jgi:hypothetical protein
MKEDAEESLPPRPLSPLRALPHPQGLRCAALPPWRGKDDQALVAVAVHRGHAEERCR